MTTPYEKKYDVPTIKRYGAGFIVQPKEGDIMRSKNFALVEKELGEYCSYLDYIELEIQRDKLLEALKEIITLLDSTEMPAYKYYHLGKLMAEIEAKKKKPPVTNLPPRPIYGKVEDE